MVSLSTRLLPRMSTERTTAASATTTLAIWNAKEPDTIMPAERAAADAALKNFLVAFIGLNYLVLVVPTARNRISDRA